jgi:hypothetical protein
MAKDQWYYRKGWEDNNPFSIRYPLTNQCLYMNFGDCIPKILYYSGIIIHRFGY